LLAGAFGEGVGLDFAAFTAAMLRATDPRTPRPPLAMVLALSPPLLIFAVCVARSLPLAVRNLPPRAVAPSPVPVIRPALFRVSRFVPLLTRCAGGRAALVVPLDENRPLASLLYCLRPPRAMSCYLSVL